MLHGAADTTGSYLIDPVGVQDAEASDLAANTLLSHTAQVSGRLELSDALAGRLSIDDTLQNKNIGKLHVWVSYMFGSDP